MPSDEYKTAIGGGLKLKGSKPAGVTKSKKKKKSKAKSGDTELSRLRDALDEDRKGEDEGEEGRESSKKAIIEDEEDLDDGKTPAQRRHEEMKRKRLDERVEREGVKSHKERVEDFNKHLSKLSEHNDMPRIGPG